MNIINGPNFPGNYQQPNTTTPNNGQTVSNYTVVAAIDPGPGWGGNYQQPKGALNN